MDGWGWKLVLDLWRVSLITGSARLGGLLLSVDEVFGVASHFSILSPGVGHSSVFEQHGR